MNEQFQKTHLAHSVEKTEYETQYDENVKALLADKQVIARLAKHRIEEFRNYSIEEIIDCIEGDPEISSVSIYPGKRTDAISGMNVESKERCEGEVTFDVRFYMLTKEQKRIKIIVNLDYSDFRVIPINSFFRLYLKPFKTVYRNKFLIAS